MDTQNLYNTIFKRKSVRKYDLTPLPEADLSKVSEHIQALKTLIPGVRSKIDILSSREIKNLTPVKAPHYLVFFSEEKDGFLTNAGFILQQMDLFLSSNGIGSCWIGMAKPQREILKKSELDFVIMLAFGKPKEPIYRKDIWEFKRKPLEEITNISGSNELLEPVRLAPSATNSQPWYFIGEDNKIHVYCIKAKALKSVLYEKVNKIDMGIALCHLWIAAEYFQKNMDIIYDDPARKAIPAGYFYIATVIIEQ